jgi:hypothetical protein
MISFHVFLNNYRQTPRSRFIRKYKPAEEPIFEEISVFEKSYMSSQVAGLTIGGPIHDLETTMQQIMEKTQLDQSNS